MANSTFTAIKDGATTLQFGADIDADFPFDAPGIDTTKKAVLTYVVEPDPAGSDSDVVLRLDINGTSVTTNSFGSTQGRVLQEIVEANLLKETGNTLTATLTDADGAGSCVLRGCRRVLQGRLSARQGSAQAPSRLARSSGVVQRTFDRPYPLKG